MQQGRVRSESSADASLESGKPTGDVRVDAVFDRQLATTPLSGDAAGLASEQASAAPASLKGSCCQTQVKSCCSATPAAAAKVDEVIAAAAAADQLGYSWLPYAATASATALLVAAGFYYRQATRSRQAVRQLAATDLYFATAACEV
jgi:hypothetical protein